MGTDRKPVIDHTREAEGFLFDTHPLRCQYLGKTSREKPRWLEEHKGQFQRVEDILKESARLEPPDNAGATPTELNCETSSPDTRKDVSSVGTPPERCSPPCQPESVPEPVNENELPPSAEAVTEANGSETETTSLGSGRKQSRGTGRRRKKRRPTAKVTNACSKFSPERGRVVLDSLSERPIQSYAAEKAGIHRRTLENWIKRSKAGEDGYDIEHQDVTVRFHVHCEWSKEAAYDKILEAAYLIAMGKAYVTDENGNVTLETVRPPNPKMIRFFWSWYVRRCMGTNPRSSMFRSGAASSLSARPRSPKELVRRRALKPGAGRRCRGSFARQKTSCFGKPHSNAA